MSRLLVQDDALTYGKVDKGEDDSLFHGETPEDFDCCCGDENPCPPGCFCCGGIEACCYGPGDTGVLRLEFFGWSDVTGSCNGDCLTTCDPWVIQAAYEFAGYDGLIVLFLPVDQDPEQCNDAHPKNDPQHPPGLLLAPSFVFRICATGEWRSFPNFLNSCNANDYCHFGEEGFAGCHDNSADGSCDCPVACFILTDICDGEVFDAGDCECKIHTCDQGFVDFENGDCICTHIIKDVRVNTWDLTRVACPGVHPDCGGGSGGPPCNLGARAARGARTKATFSMDVSVGEAS